VPETSHGSDWTLLATVGPLVIGVLLIIWVVCCWRSTLAALVGAWPTTTPGEVTSVISPLCRLIVISRLPRTARSAGGRAI
jgi:hypothetical protein